jgi:hypothetical protein
MSRVSPRSCADGVHWYAKAWQKLYETAVQVMGVTWVVTRRVGSAHK